RVRGEWAAAREDPEQTAAVSEVEGFQLFSATSQFWLGQCAVFGGGDAPGFAQIRTGLDGIHATGNEAHDTLAFARMADALLTLNRANEALGYCDKAMQFAER